MTYQQAGRADRMLATQLQSPTLFNKPWADFVHHSEESAACYPDIV